jgi:hypothetical protein
MKNLKITLTLLSFIISLSASSSVWEAKPGLNWDAYWDIKFQKWVKNEVEGDFFKKLGGKYKDLPLDCADAFYGLHIYFSFKNSLPWKSAGQKWNRRDNYPTGYSNEMTNWDNLRSPNDRVASLIEFILGRLGTESLANLDTYPVSLNDVKPGDMYMYKYGSSGSYTRHAYIIKDVNSDGTFDVLYGTQLRAKKLWALGRVGAEYLQHKPDLIEWGFKRYKNNQDSEVPASKIPVSNYEQYEVAKRVTETQFFDYVNTVLRIFEETPSKKTSRLLNGLCRSLRAREIVVNDAIEWQEENPRKCMKEQSYDAYSTPSRDLGIKKKFEQLGGYYEKLKRENLESKISARYKRIIEAIFNSYGTSRDVEKFCSLSVGNSQLGYESVNLANFYRGLKSLDVSFHPNDNLLRRWGFNSGRKTRCKQYYGYKE